MSGTYPIVAFAAGLPSAIATATPPVPTLVLTGTINSTFMSDLSSGLSARVRQAASPSPAAATHLGFGVRARVDFAPGPQDEISVDGWLRVDLARVRLRDGATAPNRPVERAELRIQVKPTSGWLVGGPGGADGTASIGVKPRVRWMELGAVLTPSASGAVVDPLVVLHDAGLDAGCQDVSLADPSAPALIGLAASALAAAAPNSPAAQLLDALRRLEIVTDDGQIAADALSAIRADPIGFLEPRLFDALGDGSLLGLAGPNDAGEWTYQTTGIPLEIVLTARPWRVGVRTVIDAAATDDATFSLTASAFVDASLAASWQLGATLGPVSIGTDSASRDLNISAPPWLQPANLVNPPADLRDQVVVAARRLMVSSATSALIEGALGSNVVISPIDQLLSDPFAWFANALGDGGRPSAAKVTAALNALADALSFSHGRGIMLPANIELWAEDGPADVLIAHVSASPLASATIGSIGAVVSLSIDRTGHVTPAATVSLTANTSGSWGNVSLVVADDATGIRAWLTTSAQPPGVDLYPTPNLGALASSAATYLLPAILDELVTLLPSSAIVTDVLNFADALGLRTSGHFTSSGLALLTTPNWLSNPGAALSTALGALVPALLSGVTATGSMVQWSSAPLILSFAWGSTPKLHVEVASPGLAGGPLTLASLVANLSLSMSGGTVTPTVTTSLAVDITAFTKLGFAVTPRFTASFASPTLTVQFLPVGTAASVTFQLSPTPAVLPNAAALEQFAVAWLPRLAGDALLAAFSSVLTKTLWAGGPSVGHVLNTTGMITAAQAPAGIAATLPDLHTVLFRILDGIGSVDSHGTPPAPLKITDDLSLTPHSDPTRGLGVTFKGTIAQTIGDYKIELRFGTSPAGWLTLPDAGVSVFLAQKQGTTYAFAPSLVITGLGVAFESASDAPLVDADIFRIDGAAGYFFMTLDLHIGGGATLAAGSFGGAIEIDGLGLPLGQALGGGGSSNPVASALLASQPGGSSGDSQAVVPKMDVAAYLLPGASTPSILITGENAGGIVWIPIHAAFGPVFIEQLGVAAPDNPPSLELIVDGGVKVAGITAELQELSVTVPIDQVRDPSRWSLDLAGIAVAYDQGGVSIAGGLLKALDQGDIEYRGMLVVKIADKGLSVLGAFGSPHDAQGHYTSLFVFGALLIPLGGPPYLFITGVGGGLGYNRQIEVPDDVGQLPSFPLVAAMDGSLADDPMAALASISTYFPAARGSLWLAAGVQFTTFVTIETIALAYVALDKGLEIGILGLTTLQLPPDTPPDDVLASIQLALKARFSSSEMLLSISGAAHVELMAVEQRLQAYGRLCVLYVVREGQLRPYARRLPSVVQQAGRLPYCAAARHQLVGI